MGAEIFTAIFLYFPTATVIMVIGALVTSQYDRLRSYELATCGPITNVGVSNTLAFHKCWGYTQVSETGAVVKLVYPAYNYLLVRASEEDCNKWISVLSTGDHRCYVENLYIASSVGYANLPSIVGYICMLVISCIMLILVGIYTISRRTVGGKGLGDTIMV